MRRRDLSGTRSRWLRCYSRLSDARWQFIAIIKLCILRTLRTTKISYVRATEIRGRKIRRYSVWQFEKVRSLAAMRERLWWKKKYARDATQSWMNGAEMEGDETRCAYISRSVIATVAPRTPRGSWSQQRVSLVFLSTWFSSQRYRLRWRCRRHCHRRRRRRRVVLVLVLVLVLVVVLVLVFASSSSLFLYLIKLQYHGINMIASASLFLTLARARARV